MYRLLAQQGSGEFRLSFEPLFEDHGLALAVMGILVVFLALTLLVVFITLLPRLLERTLARESQTTAPADPEITLKDELPEETLVVIAAAVAETIRQPHRIVRIRGLTPEDLGWSLEGRLQHHASHRLQRHDPR